MKRLQIITILSLCLIVSLLLGTSVNAFGSLKSNIQKELDVNPFLKKEGVKLRVTEESSGYVTIEMYEGNREVREAIDRGNDVITGQAEIEMIWRGDSVNGRKTIIALRRAIAYVKKMEDVKDVMLIAALNTKQDRCENLFDDAVGLYEKEKYNQAVNLFNESAALGCVRAYTQLALMYDNGKGVKKDTEKSITWYLKAIEGGDKDSYSSLGLIYHKQGNYNKAIYYYKKGAEQGVVSSQTRLAYLYATCKNSKFHNGKEAVRLALKVVDPDDPRFSPLSLLAAAYARNGEYGKAVETQEKAISELNKNEVLRNKKEILALFNSRLILYKKGQPFTYE